MLLLEHEGKEILREYGIPTPHGTVIETADLARTAASSLHFPAVLKPQVPCGGRGRAGGVLAAATAEAFQVVASRVVRRRRKGFPVERILVENQEAIRHEYYLAVTFDGEDQLLLVGSRGGVDVECITAARAASSRRCCSIPCTALQNSGSAAPPASWRSIPRCRARSPISASRLARLFRAYDATLAEINPLAEPEAD